jgi:hypothetical protein
MLTTTTTTTTTTTVGAPTNAAFSLAHSEPPRHARIVLNLTQAEAEYLNACGYTPRRLTAMLHRGVAIDSTGVLERLTVGMLARERVLMALSFNGRSTSPRSLPNAHDVTSTLLAWERLDSVSMNVREREVTMRLLQAVSEGEQPRTERLFLRLSDTAWASVQAQAASVGITGRRLLRAFIAEAIATGDDARTVDADGSVDNPFGRLGDSGSLPSSHARFISAHNALQEACMKPRTSAW